MYKKELIRFRTGIDVHTIHDVVTLSEYIHDNEKSEYVVIVYNYKKGSISQKSFDNISAAKRRFLFEVENATIFSDLD